MIGASLLRLFPLEFWKTETIVSNGHTFHTKQQWESYSGDTSDTVPWKILVGSRS